MLNCPKSRMQAKREAEFRGCFGSLAEASDDALIITDAKTSGFPTEGKLWAAFLLQTAPAYDGKVRIRHADGTADEIPTLSCEVELRAAFVVDADGSMHDDEGRRLYVERRLARPGVG
jgi:hypothetical protein